MPSIFIRPNGSIEFLYSDRLPGLLEAGKASIKRASIVEPNPENPKEWYADMAPSGGPILGPFKSRKDALEKEEEWLVNLLARSNKTDRPTTRTCQ